MTIQGAVYELECMMLRDDIPDYIKPTIKKVIETVVDEYNEILKAVPMSVIEEIKSDIIEMRKRDPLYYYVSTEDILDWVLNTIDRKVKEHTS